MKLLPFAVKYAAVIECYAVYALHGCLILYAVNGVRGAGMMSQHGNEREQLLNAFGEFVYVADIHTYELLYMNERCLNFSISALKITSIKNVMKSYRALTRPAPSVQINISAMIKCTCGNTKTPILVGIFPSIIN